MARQQVNPQLLRALSQEDERAYRLKMTSALCLDIAQEDAVYRAELDSNSRREIVRTTLQQLTGKQRRRLFAMKLKKGKDDIAVLEPFLLSESIRSVQQAHESLQDFDGIKLNGATATLFTRLYEAAASALPLYLKLWENTEVAMSAIHSTIVHGLQDGVKSELSHFMSQREMQDIYREQRNKERIRDIVLERISEYLSSIDPDEFEALRPSILPLYYLRPLALFPFDELFSNYGFSGNPRQAENPHHFDLVTGIEHIERLFYALYFARRLPEDSVIHEQLVRVAYENQIDAIEINRTQNAVTWLADTARTFSESIPLADIIRVARKDPFYRIQVYRSRIQLDSFFRASLSRHVLRELDRRFGDIRMGVIGSLIQELFHTQLPPLENYGSTDNAPEQRYGLPSFKYALSMQALITFLTRYYQSVIQEDARILTRIMPARLRDEQEALMHHASAFEDVVERIMDIDRRLGPEETDGQKLTRLRQNLAHDVTQQRAFRTFVDRYHQDALGLINKALEHINGIRRVFQTVIDLNSRNIEESYLTFEHSTRGKGSLKDTLVKDLRLLDYVNGLVVESLAFDDGY